MVGWRLAVDSVQPSNCCSWPPRPPGGHLNHPAPPDWAPPTNLLPTLPNLTSNRLGVGVSELFAKCLLGRPRRWEESYRHWSLLTVRRGNFLKYRLVRCGAGREPVSLLRRLGATLSLQSGQPGENYLLCWSNSSNMPFVLR